MTARRPVQQKDSVLIGWLRDNALGLFLGVVTVVGGYTAWQVSESNYKAVTDHKIETLEQQVKTNKDELQDDGKMLGELARISNMNQQQLIVIEKSEEKLQVSIEKLTDSVNNLAASVVGIQAKQDVVEKMNSK